MRLLADTGIILRLMHVADPDHGVVEQAVTRLRARGDRLVIGAQNAAEFWNVCTRPKTARGGFGLTIPETDRRLGVVEKMFQVLPDLDAAYAVWRRLVVAHGVQGKQVHDARLVALMEGYGITHILTLNGPDFARYPGVTVIGPADAGAGLAGG